ncbi:hypothetical protein NDU88_009014 [Pleurodeles waltl]|uniref:Uncharacterized protein n=1 Tax=Pleurodeles waltl TaxID=8319 RepID=A0AAV7QQB8_PLEWA|nr:hypothetical protein NDU88_009014 [Pleurodeles waltl]
MLAPGRIRLPQSSGGLFKSPPKKATPSLPVAAAGSTRGPAIDFAAGCWDFAETELEEPESCLPHRSLG